MPFLSHPPVIHAICDPFGHTSHRILTFTSTIYVPIPTQQQGDRDSCMLRTFYCFAMSERRCLLSPAACRFRRCALYAAISLCPCPCPARVLVYIPAHGWAAEKCWHLDCMPFPHKQKVLMTSRGTLSLCKWPSPARISQGPSPSSF